MVGYRDAQFEMVEALLSNLRVQSYAEQTLSPLFRRGWASGYAAVEEGQPNEVWLKQAFCEQVPSAGVQVFPLDTTVWPHPSEPGIPTLTATPCMGCSRVLPFAAGQLVSMQNWEVQVLETIRSEEAWEVLYEANYLNDPPPGGEEYLYPSLSPRLQ